MRFLSRLTILTLMVGAAPATVLPASTFESVLARIEIATSHGTEKSTSFLVHQQRAGDGAILYYLTSARPFRDSAADLRASIRRIRLIRPGEVPIEIAPADVTLPMGNMLDVAVQVQAIHAGHQFKLADADERLSVARARVGRVLEDLEQINQR